ncbi:hypothetical protein CP978_15240 [Streptomyces nodosus]|uniref:Uncharacterized protein n=1 Tax=Streptomyces nodosus TaxID=40318 RepID=A0A5P2W634_9ACTN|nr:hypothetical protein CP978_15240 [Streptomyces nodosus]
MRRGPPQWPRSAGWTRRLRSSRTAPCRSGASEDPGGPGRIGGPGDPGTSGDPDGPGGPGALRRSRRGCMRPAVRPREPRPIGVGCRPCAGPCFCARRHIRGLSDELLGGC